MRRRLSATLLAIIGLGVPLLVALMTRRSDDDGAAPSARPAVPGSRAGEPTSDLLSNPQAPAGARGS